MVNRNRTTNRPLLSKTSSRNGNHGPADADGSKLPFDINDEVGQHVRDRHVQLGSGHGAAVRLSDVRGRKPILGFGDGLDQAEEDAEEIEPELYERDVLPVDVSDSEEDGESDSGADDNDEGSEDAADQSLSVKEKLEQRDWGPRRHVWYGGDNSEYEVMAEEERDAALAEEEEEAIALQKQAVDTLLPQDFMDSDLEHTTGEGGDDEKVDRTRRNASDSKGNAEEQPGSDDITRTISEIPILMKEAAACEKQLETLRSSIKSDQTAAILFHLSVLFLQNVACLLVIQSDPAAAHVDIRKHPVIARIASIRSLIAQARRALPASVGRSNSQQLAGKLNGKGLDPSMGNSIKKKKSHVAKEHLADRLGGTHSGKASTEQAEVAKTSRSLKEKSKRKRSMSSSEVESIVEADDEQANALLENIGGDIDANQDTGAVDGRKRNKLNRLVGEMERDRHNKLARRSASGDADAARDTRRMKSAVVNTPVGLSSREEDGDGVSDDGMANLEDVLESKEHDKIKMTAKERRKERKAHKLAKASKPHVYSFNDTIEPDSKRKASRNIVANRGLTRYRPRTKKTPRTRNRLAYETAIKKRRSVVRDFKGYPGISYSGEATGINMAARKSTNLSSF